MSDSSAHDLRFAGMYPCGPDSHYVYWLTCVDIRIEAKVPCAPLDKARPELQGYRASRFIIRHGEDAVIADIGAVAGFGLQHADG